MITVERRGMWANSELEKELSQIIESVKKQVSELDKMPLELQIQGEDFIEWHKNGGNEYIEIREIDNKTGFITEFQSRYLKFGSQVPGILASLRADGW